MAWSGTVSLILGVAVLAVVGARWPAAPPDRPVSIQVAALSPAPLPSPPVMAGQFRTLRSPDGHFYADGKVNGADVRFLIDTGSSTIVLTAADARRAGLGSGEATALARGAGGEVRLRPVTLTRLALGTVAADQVPAMVAEEGTVPVSLLGQSYLSRFASVTMAGDMLTLN